MMDKRFYPLVKINLQSRSASAFFYTTSHRYSTLNSTLCAQLEPRCNTRVRANSQTMPLTNPRGCRTQTYTYASPLYSISLYARMCNSVVARHCNTVNNFQGRDIHGKKLENLKYNRFSSKQDKIFNKIIINNKKNNLFNTLKCN